MHKAKNRLAHAQADYLFAIVRRPTGWRPRAVNEMPAEAEIVSETLVASFEEAKDDLLRCNSLSLRKNLDTWAIILHAGSDI